MEANVTPSTPGQPRSQVWKLFAYFAGLFVLGQLAGLVFERLQASGAFADFAKINAIIQRSLDVVHNRDDSITTVWSLLLAFLLVAPLGWVYTYTKAKEGYDKNLVQTLVVMAMVVSGMMMLIQDQFSRALALVGVVSAVRFRTNLRDNKDAVYLLLSIGIGMGTGLQVYRVAAWMTIVMCIAFLLLNRFKIGESPADEASFLELNPKKKDKKKKKDKHKKDRADTPTVGAGDGYGTPLARYGALAASLHDRAPGGLGSVAALVVDSIDAEATMGFVGEALAADGVEWHLVSAYQHDDVTTLEYLVRVEGDDLQLALVANHVKERCGTSVRDVRALVVPRPKEKPDTAAVA
jgi:hypothetical protein